MKLMIISGLFLFLMSLNIQASTEPRAGQSAALSINAIDRALNNEARRKENERIINQSETTQQLMKEYNTLREWTKYQGSLSEEEKIFGVLKTLSIIDEKKVLPLSKKTLKKYIGMEITNSSVFLMLKELHEMLYEKGFITSSIDIDRYIQETGELVLLVRAGVISAISASGTEGVSDLDAQKVVDSAYSSAAGAVFNLRDTDQAVENGKKYGYEILVDVAPGNDETSSTLAFIVKRIQRYRGSIGVNNNANSDTPERGRYSFNSALTRYSNFLALDSLTLGLTYKYFDAYPSNKENSYTVNYTSSYGRYDLSLFADFIETQELLNTNIGEFIHKANGLKVIVDNSYLIHRNQTDRSIIHFIFNNKNNSSYINDTKIQVTSKPYNDISLAYEFIGNVADNAIYTKLEYNKGIGWLNGNPTKCVGEISLCEYTAYHNKYSLRFNAHKSFTHVVYDMDVAAQYSNAALLSQYKISIGDTYSVRGFNNENTLYGDSGYYIRNTFSISALSQYGASGVITPFVGVDYGAVYNKGISGKDELASLSLGFDLSYKGLRAIPFIAAPITKADDAVLFDIVINYSF